MKDETLEILWKNVLDRWDDDETHRAFLQHCQMTEQLGEAAVRYAGMKRDGARGPSARERLETVAVLAAASLQASREPRHTGLPRWVVALAVLAFGSMALYALARAFLL
jgi:hypothetical protein